MIDFQPFRDARLGPADLAKLLQVSRVTVSGWLNSRTSPHHLLGSKVQDLLDIVSLAVDADQLPVPHNISRRERGMYIAGVIADQRARMGDVDAALTGN